MQLEKGAVTVELNSVLMLIPGVNRTRSQQCQSSRNIYNNTDILSFYLNSYFTTLMQDSKTFN